MLMKQLAPYIRRLKHLGLQSSKSHRILHPILFISRSPESTDNMQCWWMLLLAATLVAVAHASPYELKNLVRVARAADCNCKYHSGGCTIHIAAPSGFECVCVYKGFWTCTGWARGCNSGEYCPGGQYSWDACRRGGGNCGGY